MKQKMMSNRVPASERLLTISIVICEEVIISSFQTAARKLNTMQINSDGAVKWKAYLMSSGHIMEVFRAN